VLFDLDNTLHDRDRAFAAWATWFVRERLGIADGTEAAAAVDRILASDAGGHGPKEVFFRDLKERHPVLTDEIEALVAAFRRDLLAHLGPLDDGTTRVLDGLDRAGVPWGIVTNGSRNQLRKVEALGLAARARCALVSEIDGWRKPAPEMFLAAAARLGVDPSAVLFVGDHPVADMGGAARAGMRTAWLRRGRAWPVDLAGVAPDHELDSLADLLPIVGVTSWPAR
jgi:putative hydrolase of the HAD superfamily